MTRNRIVCVAAVAVCAFLTESSLEAGVAGGRFQGYVTNSTGTETFQTLDFRDDGVLIANVVEPKGGKFVGRYTEIQLPMISYWQSSPQDSSSDGTRQMYGVTILSLFTTSSTLNLDAEIVWSFGILGRTGPAQRGGE